MHPQERHPVRLHPHQVHPHQVLLLPPAAPVPRCLVRRSTLRAEDERRASEGSGASVGTSPHLTCAALLFALALALGFAFDRGDVLLVASNVIDRPVPTRAVSSRARPTAKSRHDDVRVGVGSVLGRLVPEVGSRPSTLSTRSSRPSCACVLVPVPSFRE